MTDFGTEVMYIDEKCFMTYVDVDFPISWVLAKYPDNHIFIIILANLQREVRIPIWIWYVHKLSAHIIQPSLWKTIDSVLFDL